LYIKIAAATIITTNNIANTIAAIVPAFDPDVDEDFT